MLKVVIQILLITFLLFLCYDTIDICLNQINSKNENELLIVKRELEETKQVESTITPYETYDFPVWPIALGFSCAFCSVVCHFILPLKYVERGTRKDNSHRSLKKLNKNKRNNKKESDEFSYLGEIYEKDYSKHLIDIINKNEVLYPEDRGLTTTQALSIGKDKTDSIAHKLNKQGQEKSIIDICIPKLFPDEIFQAQSSLNVINNVSFSPSLNSLEHVDCGNSKNLYNVLLESKSISKMGLPTASKSLYGEENRRRKHFSKTFYGQNCEILTVNNAIFDDNTSQRSEDSNDSIQIKQGQTMELFSMLKNDVAKPPPTPTSDKSVNVQLLTYTDNDIKNMEKKLENIEYGLKRTEEKTQDWGNRINVAETKLVDLHDQVYTMFRKFEEEKKTSYIIVSKVSKENFVTKDRDVFDTLNEESDGFEQVADSGDDEISKNKLDEETSSVAHPESAVIEEDSRIEEVEKDSSEEESEDEDQSGIDNKISDEDNQNEIEESTEVVLSELKQRSIALEALLEGKSRSQINAYLPKKKIPQLNVPPHVLPPYKRSSFAGTDSKAELRKRRLKMPNSINELYWRARM